MNSPLDHIFLSSSQTRLMEGAHGILCYHYLGTPSAKSNDPFLHVGPGDFRDQLAALRKAGFATGRLSELVSPPAAGTRTMFITVDDGARNFQEHGMTALAENGFKAIQFIVSGLIGGINEWDARHGHPEIRLMDEVQIREWLAEGHEIGSHTVNHRNLSKLGEADARREILDSKKHLEDLFGVPVRHFSYPHGKLTPRVRDLVGEAGYETASTTRFGVHSSGQDLFQLPRIQPLSASGLAAKALHRIRQKLRLCP